MKLRQMNKATAAVVSGAAVTILGAFVALDQEILGSVQTMLTAALVFLIPNGEE